MSVPIGARGSSRIRCHVSLAGIIAQMFGNLAQRLKGRYQRTAAEVLVRRPFRLQNRQPLISFTFDDFPRSALHTGGAILEASGARGTYYASFGLMGQEAPTGEIFRRDDLPLVLQRGHELGCHTFAHCHACDTPAHEFESSIVENNRALKRLAPGASMLTLSYPVSCPRPGTKRCCARYFLGCRAGGQTCNAGVTDLNNLRAFFLEQSRDDIEAVKAVINLNSRLGGWLVFATHDVCETPTRFGCKPAFFEAVVRLSLASGATILPMSLALEAAGVTACLSNTLASPGP